MNWNTKPGSSALPPPAYPRKRSPFLEQPFRSPLGSTPQSSLTYPGQNPEACVFLGSSDLATQPQLGHPQAQLRNYSAACVQSGAMVTSQTSVERVTYASIKGPKPLEHGVQVSPGLAHGSWLSPAPRNPALQHPAASGTQQSSFGTKAPATGPALQSPFVASDTYSMQLQMVPVSSSRAPVAGQGSSRLSPAPLQGFPGSWTQQPHTEYRPPQHTYPSSSFLPEPALQKASPLPARGSLPAGAALAVPPQQTVPGQPFQCTAAQPDTRAASYSCSYTGQPLPSPQHVPKHMGTELPRIQEPPTTDTRKEFCGSFQPMWPKLAENLSTLGSFCSVKVNSSTSEPFHRPAGASLPGEPFHRPAGASLPGEPFHRSAGTSVPGEPFHRPAGTSVPGEPFHRPAGASVPREAYHEPVRVPVPGMQTVVPRRQEKRVAPCTLPSNSALDTNVTKEKLVRDIKTLVEIKNKFSELARKIKINKELLMAAGCIKTTNAPYSDSAPNPELAQKESGKVPSGSLLSLLTSGATENKELDRAGGRPSSPGILESGLHGPLSPDMVPMSAQGQGRPVQTTLQTPALEGAQAAGSSTSSGSFVGVEQSAPAHLEAPSAFPPQSLREAEDKYLHKHPIILRLLEVGDHTAQGKLSKGAPETLQDSKLPEVRHGAPGAGQQLQWRAPEATGPCNTGTKDADHVLPQDLPSPASGAHADSNSPCSMELLATCLSLWRNNPAEPAKDTSPATSGPCVKSGLVAGASGSLAATSTQDSALLVAPQSHEPPSVAVSKGTELQIAVVTPLVLSSAKPLAGKGAPEMVYPVIKEGSVCSLQSCLAEEAGGPAALKSNVEGPVAHTTSPKDWAQRAPEDSPRLCPGQETQAEAGGPLPGDRDRERASENRLQIGSICSLVEGATSYNPQIAEIFSDPTCLVLAEPGDSLAEDRDTDVQNQATVPSEALAGKTAQWSADLQPPELASLSPPEPALPQLPAPASPRPLAPPPPQPPAPLHPGDGRRAAIPASELGCREERADLTLGPGPVTAAQDGSCEHTAPASTERGVLEDEMPVLYLHDQLSELLKEFPYGVAPVSTCELPPASWRLPSHGWKRPRTLKPDSAATTMATAGQIQITILNSEEMKALFPEQDLPEPDTETKPQKGELVYKESPPAVGDEEGGQQGPQTQVIENGSQGDPQAQVSEEGNRGDPPAQVSEEESQGCPLTQVSKESQGDLPAQVSKEGTQVDSPAQVSEERHWGDPPVQVIEESLDLPAQAECPKNTPVDPQKDDVPCCALGWLSAVYEGVPQCQCSLSQGHQSTKRTKRKSGHSHRSQDTPRCKQAEGSSGKEGPRHRSPLARLDRKRPFPGSGKDRDRAKARPSGPEKTQQALPRQHLCSALRLTDSAHSQGLPSRKKLSASEVVTLNPSESARSSPENRPRKQPKSSPQLLKAKVGFLSLKNKELHRGLGSRKLFLKAGMAGHKSWDKRKLEDGGSLDSATKRRKVDKDRAEQSQAAGSAGSSSGKAWGKANRLEQSQAVGPAGGARSSSSGKTWGSVSLPKEGGHRKERVGPQVKAVGTADGSPKVQRPVSTSPTHRQKNKEATTAKALRKDLGKTRQRDKQVLRPSKPGQGHLKPRGPRPALEDASKACATFEKSPQPRAEESKAHGSRPEKQAGGKPRECPRAEKNQSHRPSGSTGLSATPSRDHRKLYLNRVGFQCTERQSICLTQLDPLPRKSHREERPREGSCPRKDAGQPGMLEFKLCPESMIPKAGLGDESALLQPGPRKEQEPAQVSGIRSTKEDWLKCVTEERRPDTAQESKAAGNPRLSRRSLSADACPKDFQAMFQTYRKMYMEKRSRSLGSSPLK